MTFVPRLLRSMEGSELVSITLGHPRVDGYLEFVGARGAANTWLATAYDLKVFFEVTLPALDIAAPARFWPRREVGLESEHHMPSRPASRTSSSAGVTAWAHEVPHEAGNVPGESRRGQARRRAVRVSARPAWSRGGGACSPRGRRRRQAP